MPNGLCPADSGASGAADRAALQAYAVVSDRVGAGTGASSWEKFLNLKTQSGLGPVVNYCKGTRNASLGQNDMQ